MSNRARIRIAHLPRYRLAPTFPVREGDLVLHNHKAGEWLQYEAVVAEIEALMREVTPADGGDEQ